MVYDERIAASNTVVIQRPLPDERQPPLYFAGRKNELGMLESELDVMCATGQPPGGLLVVQGVPGVGKTQMAERYKRLVDDGQRDGVSVRARVLDPDGLSDTTSLFLNLCDMLGSEAEGDEIAEVGDRRSGASFRAGFAGASAGMSTTTDVGRHTGDLGMLLRESQAAGLWQGKALVLMIDELQRIDEDGIDRLAVLHMNTSHCPIQLIGFGLQNTIEVLANPPSGRPGISRLRSPITLDCLSREDAKDAIAGNLEAMGRLSNSGVTHEGVAALAEASFGFPQHIRGYLHGADVAIGKHGHLQGSALDEALSIGDHARSAYYDRRLRAMGRDSVKLHSLAENMAATQRAKVTRTFAEDEIGIDVVAAAIGHGVMVEGDLDTLEFGIPSFRTYMIERSRAYRNEMALDKAGQKGIRPTGMSR